MKNVIKQIKKNMWLYVMFAPVLLYYIAFKYLPLAGIQIAFKDYTIYQTVAESEWIGFKFFEQFFSSVYFWRLLRNTLMINFYDIVFGFPAPIILALLLNEVTSSVFKRTIQTISYLPHFISTVIICSMVVSFLSLNTGMINNLLANFGVERKSYLLESKYFWTIFTAMNIWKGVGWAAIIYISALTGIDPSLYEAAMVDGAGKIKQLIHITIPGILPTIAIMFILRMGNMMDVASEPILLLYNSQTYETADVFSTYIYRRGLLNADYSFATAVGLFQSVIGFILIVSTNKLSKILSNSETSLW